MSKLNIPSISTFFELSKEWEFSLYAERRNEKLWNNYEALHPEVGSMYPIENDDKNISVILPKGTIISIQRIYVRQGKSDYDSVSFSIQKCPIKTLKGRFWVKLDDANEMEYVS